MITVTAKPVATKYTILGCGWAVFNDAGAADRFRACGYKIRKIMGRDVGIMIFGYGI